MKFSRSAILSIGLALYGMSFFLIAVGHLRSGSPMRGYECAEFALTLPWGPNLFGRQGLFEGRLLEYFSLLLSGWINPAFLVAALFVFRRPSIRTTRVLAITTLAMIPLCWVVFFCRDMYPREGHIVWIAGMLLVLVEALRPQIRPALRRTTVAV